MTSQSPAEISTVIFDFDGVLADTEGLHLRAFQQVFRPRGWTLDERDYFDRYLGYDDVGLVLAFARGRQVVLTDDEVAALVSAKTTLFAGYVESGDVLFSDAPACVDRLAQRFGLGIASGALKAEITAILRMAGLLERFPVIVAADDVTECKPAPEPYLKAAAALGVDPSACVAIEDSAAGLSAARAAGMRTIGVTTTSPAHLITHADLVVDSLREISAATIAGLAHSVRGQ